MSVSMIYHCPFPLTDRPSGSMIRPNKMLKAFKECGYEVNTIVGKKKERSESFINIKEEIKRGKKFDFVYSESSTMPTPLVDGFKKASLLDLNILAYFGKNKIPTGLFYRDVHWRFKDLSYWPGATLGFHSKILLIQFLRRSFYYLDWYYYKRYIDCLFLPSIAMGSYLPGKWPKKICALPPGCDLIDINDEASGNNKQLLNMLYVGGVKPPLYDLKDIIKLTSKINSLLFTICCRFDEYQKVSNYYEDIIGNNINIIHSQGEELDGYYRHSDIFIITLGNHPYMNFASPVKLFECLGYCLPVITLKGTGVARLVEKESAGWVVSSYDELSALLKRLQLNKEIIEEKKKHIKMIRNKHTWISRAKLVSDVMINIK